MNEYTTKRIRSDGHQFVSSSHHYLYRYIVSNDRYKQKPSVTVSAWNVDTEMTQLFQNKKRSNCYNFFFGGGGKRNEYYLTVTILLGDR
jgi:hypothetical protein